MIYLIDPNSVRNQRCITKGICGRLTIYPPNCPPNNFCPLF